MVSMRLMPTGLALVMALTLPGTAAASSDRGCEARLINELNRTPNDALHGQITDQVKMSPAALLAAYQRGVFPWDTTAAGNSVWHSPPQRGILRFDNLHISTKDRRYIERENKA